jgi:hypothetical protein
MRKIQMLTLCLAMIAFIYSMYGLSTVLNRDREIRVKIKQYNGEKPVKDSITRSI